MLEEQKLVFSYMVRKYHPKDRGQCRALWRELTEWHREIYQDQNIGRIHPEDYFDKHLAEIGSDRIWVATDKEQVVGFIGLIVKGNEGEVEPLIVSRAYRLKGIGKLLLKEVVREAPSMGIRLLSVKPIARNVEAIKFFYKQGFKNLGEVELFMDFTRRRWKRGPKLFRCHFNF